MPVVARASTSPSPPLSLEVVDSTTALTTYRCITTPSMRLSVISLLRISMPLAPETNRPNALPWILVWSMAADT